MTIFIILLVIAAAIFLYIKLKKKPVDDIFLLDFFKRLKKGSEDYTSVISSSKYEDYNSILVFYESKLHEKLVGVEDFIAAKYKTEINGEPINNSDLDFYFHRNHLRNYEFYLKDDISRMVFDSEYQLPLSVYPKGRLKLEIVDYNKLFYNIIRFVDEFELKTFEKYAFSEINTYLVNALAEYLSNQEYSVIEANYYLSEIEEGVRAEVNKFVDELGLKITEFYLFEIEIKDSKNQRAINEILLSYQKFNLPEYSYQNEKKIEYYKEHKPVGKPPVIQEKLDE